MFKMVANRRELVSEDGSSWVTRLTHFYATIFMARSAVLNSKSRIYGTAHDVVSLFCAALSGVDRVLLSGSWAVKVLWDLPITPSDIDIVIEVTAFDPAELLTHLNQSLLKPYFTTKKIFWIPNESGSPTLEGAIYGIAGFLDILIFVTSVVPSRPRNIFSLDGLKIDLTSFIRGCPNGDSIDICNIVVPKSSFTWTECQFHAEKKWIFPDEWRTLADGPRRIEKWVARWPGASVVLPLLSYLWTPGTGVHTEFEIPSELAVATHENADRFFQILITALQNLAKIPGYWQPANLTDYAATFTVFMNSFAQLVAVGKLIFSDKKPKLAAESKVYRSIQHMCRQRPIVSAWTAEMVHQVVNDTLALVAVLYMNYPNLDRFIEFFSQLEILLPAFGIWKNLGTIGRHILDDCVPFLGQPGRITRTHMIHLCDVIYRQDHPEWIADVDCWPSVKTVRNMVFSEQNSAIKIKYAATDFGQCLGVLITDCHRLIEKSDLPGYLRWLVWMDCIQDADFPEIETKIRHKKGSNRKNQNGANLARLFDWICKMPCDPGDRLSVFGRMVAELAALRRWVTENRVVAHPVILDWISAVLNAPKPGGDDINLKLITTITWEVPELRLIRYWCTGHGQDSESAAEGSIEYFILENQLAGNFCMAEWIAVWQTTSRNRPTPTSLLLRFNPDFSQLSPDLVEWMVRHLRPILPRLLMPPDIEHTIQWILAIPSLKLWALVFQLDPSIRCLSLVFAAIMARVSPEVAVMIVDILASRVDSPVEFPVIIAAAAGVPVSLIFRFIPSVDSDSFYRFIDSIVAHDCQPLVDSILEMVMQSPVVHFPSRQLVDCFKRLGIRYFRTDHQYDDGLWRPLFQFADPFEGTDGFSNRMLEFQFRVFRNDETNFNCPQWVSRAKKFAMVRPNLWAFLVTQWFGWMLIKGIHRPPQWRTAGEVKLTKTMIQEIANHQSLLQWLKSTPVPYSDPDPKLYLFTLVCQPDILIKFWANYGPIESEFLKIICEFSESIGVDYGVLKFLEMGELAWRNDPNLIATYPRDEFIDPGLNALIDGALKTKNLGAMRIIEWLLNNTSLGERIGSNVGRFNWICEHMVAQILKDLCFQTHDSAYIDATFQLLGAMLRITPGIQISTPYLPYFIGYLTFKIDHRLTIANDIALIFGWLSQMIQLERKIKANSLLFWVHETMILLRKLRIYTVPFDTPKLCTADRFTIATQKKIAREFLVLSNGNSGRDAHDFRRFALWVSAILIANTNADLDEIKPDINQFIQNLEVRPWIDEMVVFVGFSDIIKHRFSVQQKLSFLMILTDSVDHATKFYPHMVTAAIDLVIILGNHASPIHGINLILLTEKLFRYCVRKYAGPDSPTYRFLINLGLTFKWFLSRKWDKFNEAFLAFSCRFPTIYPVKTVYKPQLWIGVNSHQEVRWRCGDDLTSLEYMFQTCEVVEIYAGDSDGALCGSA